MFSRKKGHENIGPVSRGLAAKKGQAVTQNDQESTLKAGVLGKVKKTGPGLSKRAAFGDLTNATKVKNTAIDGKKKVGIKATAIVKPNAVNLKSKPKVKKTVSKDETLQSSQESISSSTSSSSIVTSSQETLPDTREEEDISFKEEEPKDELQDLVEFDRENFEDVFNVGRYAQDIFDYYKRRERMFPISHYMSNGKHQINPGMRAILVDWLVELQENFELNHETLYLAVKLTDLYLSIVDVKKEALQLVGAAAVFIAAKFDERFPPLIEDFTYVCDNAFDRQEFLEMEMEVLRRVDFDIGIPISYRFLRRYAKVSKVTMRTLTLARFILESSLMEYSLIVEKDSRVAAAALFVAMGMTKNGAWEGDVVKSSGYSLDDIRDLVISLNNMLHGPPVPQLSTVRSKYSHSVFHEVAKIKAVPTDVLLS